LWDKEIKIRKFWKICKRLVRACAPDVDKVPCFGGGDLGKRGTGSLGARDWTGAHFQTLLPAYPIFSSDLMHASTWLSSFSRLGARRGYDGV
jgi:hypothetical protein